MRLLLWHARLDYITIPIDVLHFQIMNNGSISWHSLPLEIHLEEKTFIKDFLVSELITD